MKGKSKEEIENTKKLMLKWLCNKYNGECIIIESIIEDREGKSELECFSESIYHMSTANTLCMGKDWEYARGCRLEHDIAKAYGLEIIYYDSVLNHFKLRNGCAEDIKNKMKKVKGVFDIIIPSDIRTPLVILCCPDYDKNTLKEIIEECIPISVSYKIVLLDLEQYKK